MNPPAQVVHEDSLVADRSRDPVAVEQDGGRVGVLSRQGGVKRRKSGTVPIDERPGGLLAHLWENISPEPNSGCWLWTGHYTGSGYGGIGMQCAGTRVAHRAMYELCVGPIPKGLGLDHLCRVRICVNPAHLEPVTPGENVRRGRVSRGLSQPDPTKCGAGHPWLPETTGIDKHGYRYCRVCMRRRAKEARARKPIDYAALTMAHGSEYHRAWLAGRLDTD